jgi:transcriptional regulator with XRE-family HTH domain
MIPGSERSTAGRCRRPIARAEVAPLTRLGESLRLEREDRALAVRALARTAGVSERHLRRLERGERRTRRSTLERLSRALATEPRLAESLVSRWGSLAGEALAPESGYADRVDRRRTRRQRKSSARPVNIDITDYEYALPGFIVERRESRRLKGRHRYDVAVHWRVTTRDGVRVSPSHEAMLLRVHGIVETLDRGNRSSTTGGRQRQGG